MRFAASTAIGPMALALACCGTRVFWQPAGALRWPAAGPSWRGLLAGVNQRQNMCPAAPGSLVQRSETGGHGGHQNRPPAPGRVGVLSLRVREVVRAARVAIRDGTAVYSAQLHCNPAHMAPFGHYLCSNKGAQTIHFHTEVVKYLCLGLPQKLLAVVGPRRRRGHLVRRRHGLERSHAHGKTGCTKAMRIHGCRPNACIE